MSIEKRLEKLETASAQEAGLRDWQLVTVIRAGGSSTYAENVVTGEKDGGYYLDAIRKDKSYRAIEVVIGKPRAQSIEVGGVASV